MSKLDRFLDAASIVMDDLIAQGKVTREFDGHTGSMAQEIIDLRASNVDLLEACQYTLNQIDYLQNLFGKEGVVDGIAGRLRLAIIKAGGDA